MKACKSEKKVCAPLSSARSLVILFACLGMQAIPFQRLQASEARMVITDGGITAAVKSELRFEKGVSPTAIEVNTSQGIVTLSGPVDNLLFKGRALKIVEAIRGVRGVIDRITVAPVSRPDEDIRKDIMTALLQDPATESYQVAVSVKNAVATLTGSVGSWWESQLAARIANGVKGLKEVRNDLVISYTGKRTDAEMAADVETRIRWDVWVAGDPIEVRVEAGRVTLTGKVGSVFERLDAEADGWVNGVKAVDDEGLKVEPELSRKDMRKAGLAFKTDQQIKQAVLDSFHYDPRLTGFSPAVNVEDGVVILSGKVSHLKAKTAAEKDARNILGVSEVDNLLMLDPLLILPGDADTQKALRAALSWDPLLAGSHIEAAVVNHEAYLSGSVNDFTQYSEATDIASRVKGVALIRNHLEVEPDFSVYGYDYYDWPYPNRFGDTFGPAPVRSDEQIKKSIERAFFWSPFVHRNDIKVTVDGGVAMLSGTVGSWVGYEEAYKDARKSGATDVVLNKLKVRNGAWF